ncbi:hypothetical protein ACS0TY_028601 [Phlomoides rotata]
MIIAIAKPPALISPLITPLNIANHHSSILTSPSRLNSSRRRRRFRPQASSLVLPLLPFPVDQVLVPSEVKTLHLYEARYIALLEEVKRLEVGALVLIRGVGRVKVLEFKQAQPYLTGEVSSLQDNVLHKMTEIGSKVLELKEALHSLNSLEIKLKAPGTVSLQTQTTNSLVWAEKQPTLDCNADFIPSLAERVSFAALQPISGASQSELFKLQREKMIAMDATDTLERLKKSIQLAKDNISLLAAKLAIQSLEMH